MPGIPTTVKQQIADSTGAIHIQNVFRTGFPVRQIDSRRRCPGLLNQHQQNLHQGCTCHLQWHERGFRPLTPNLYRQGRNMDKTAGHAGTVLLSPVQNLVEQLVTQMVARMVR